MTNLINCKACKRAISPNAKTCPHCGELREVTSMAAWIVAGLLVFFVLAAVVYFLLAPVVNEATKLR